ncbi:hypothetical protein DSAG12_00491 [Promethearchaeum syntrophicum]|uniref:Uncharacterized protein n=1 Tax=Promethearchaeum syntrophicum TaxID=2594042 RepID=A0A5B9D6B1_9ARCH|nr:hypothetical protein [Candidatus Prometheoarchaeum syntrophicum]QEE14678.1 hypothetical protein DSAG12_00491 [Candidatus Prometheoarchaeum syntrophicum]
MKSKSIVKIGVWTVLTSALAISLFLIPTLAEYIIVVLTILIIYGIAQFTAQLRVRKELSIDQSINTSLQCSVLLVVLLILIL